MSKSMLAEQSEPSPYNHHLQQFLTFLKQERGFADATIVNRKRSLKPFLAWLVAQGVPLSGVSPVVITKYFTGAVAGKWKRTSVSFHVQSLRSFFRYASSRGWCAAGIAESIDAPRLYTHENLPQGPSWEEVKKLLASVNGTSSVQVWSRCAVLLCAVYGLRVGEVCRLRLDHIDWSDEKISVRRSKQRKVQTYPLTTEVGNALLRYLREVRPRCAHREVTVSFWQNLSSSGAATLLQSETKRSVSGSFSKARKGFTAFHPSSSIDTPITAGTAILILGVKFHVPRDFRFTSAAPRRPEIKRTYENEISSRHWE